MAVSVRWPGILRIRQCLLLVGMTRRFAYGRKTHSRHHFYVDESAPGLHIDKAVSINTCSTGLNAYRRLQIYMNTVQHSIEQHSPGVSFQTVGPLH